MPQPNTASTNNTITIGFLYMMVPNDPVTHSVCVIGTRLDPEIPLHKEASFGSSSPPQLLSLAVQVASHTAGGQELRWRTANGPRQNPC